MGKLGFFLLGAVAGVVGTAVAAWAHEEYCGGSSSSSSDYDSDEEAANLSSQREELDEKIEDIKAQREVLEEKMKDLISQREGVERDINAIIAAEAQAISCEASANEQTPFDETHATAPA